MWGDKLGLRKGEDEGHFLKGGRGEREKETETEQEGGTINMDRSREGSRMGFWKGKEGIVCKPIPDFLLRNHLHSG